jgi:hypothetical protein
MKIETLPRISLTTYNAAGTARDQPISSYLAGLADSAVMKVFSEDFSL